MQTVADRGKTWVESAKSLKLRIHNAPKRGKTSQNAYDFAIKRLGTHGWGGMASQISRSLESAPDPLKPHRLISESGAVRLLDFTFRTSNFSIRHISQQWRAVGAGVCARGAAEPFIVRLKVEIWVAFWLIFEKCPNRVRNGRDLKFRVATLTRGLHSF